MRILANENFPGEAVDALRARGHDVFWVRTDSPGSPDDEIVKRAASEHRILVTFDKDFRLPPRPLLSGRHRLIPH